MIVGIFASGYFVTSYRVVKPRLECVGYFRVEMDVVLSSLSLIESTLAAAAALAMLFILSSILVPVYAQRYFRKMPIWPWMSRI